MKDRVLDEAAAGLYIILVFLACRHGGTQACRIAFNEGQFAIVQVRPPNNLPGK